MAATPTRTRKKRATKKDVPGRIMVQTRILRRQDGEEDEEVLVDEYEEIEIQVFETDPAFVGVKAGTTKSLRQFESLRVDVTAQLPCYVERMDETFAYAADWAADKLMEEVDKYFGVEGDGEED